MNILVCVKRVPAPGARIVVTADGQDIDTNMLGFTISPHEECAVEEAVQMAERLGGTTTVLTLGPPEAEEQLRTAVSVGADRAVLLPTDIADWDPVATSRALVAAVAELESEQAFDLILFGNESADTGGYQVGIRTARALGRPMVTGIKGVEITDGRVEARRETPDGAEVYLLPLPAVIGVKEGINLPRYPTLKGRMAARKAEIVQIPPTHQPGTQSKLELSSPPQSGSVVEILGEGPEAASRAVDILEELGLA